MHCVDLGKSLSMSLLLNFFSNEIAIQTHIYLQNLVSIQPRTSPLKFAASLRWALDWAGDRLVERFDIEPFSDFTTKWSNFRGLVLGCMDSYDSNQILILQGFSRSTRFAILCTAQISKFQQKLAKFCEILKNGAKALKNRKSRKSVVIIL